MHLSCGFAAIEAGGALQHMDWFVEGPTLGCTSWPTRRSSAVARSGLLEAAHDQGSFRTPAFEFFTKQEWPSCLQHVGQSQHIQTRLACGHVVGDGLHALHIAYASLQDHSLHCSNHQPGACLVADDSRIW